MKAIGYVRVSTEEQATEGMSIAAQCDKINTYAKLKDFELIDIIIDGGKSAKNLDRPGFHRLMKMVDDGGVNAIVVYKLDRMFRSTVDAISTMEKFKNLGVALNSIQETLDTESAFGRFLFTILSALGQLEREVISERTKMVLDHKKNSGLVYGPIPYGKMRDPCKTDSLIDCPVECGVIKKILYFYRNAYSYNKIAEQLNRSNIKSRSGGNWYSQQVKNVLKNLGVI